MRGALRGARARRACACLHQSPIIGNVSAKVIRLSSGPRRRVLIGHRRSDVRHVLRTLIESESNLVVEVADGDAALAELECACFDLLVLELDLPLKDGVTLMQLHRVLLAHERYPVEPPAIVFTLASEVRGNTALTDHLHTLGVSALIDDAPRPEVAAVVDGILRAGTVRVAGKPAAA